jgi:hypothetical protein
MREPTTNNQQPRRPPGAPRGDLNALRGGRSSAQFQMIAAALLAHPEVSTAGAAPGLVARLLPEVIRSDKAARKQAEERVRQIMAPYQPERLVERLAHRLLIAIVEDQKK